MVEVSITCEGTSDPVPGAANYTVGNNYVFTAAAPAAGKRFGFWMMGYYDYTADPVTITIALDMDGLTLKAIYVDWDCNIRRSLDMEETADVSTGPGNEWEYASVYFYPDDCVVARSAVQAHVGTYSMLTQIDGGTESKRRNEIMHLWNPITSTELWTIAWVYLPAGFVVGEFHSLVRPIYERYWGDAGEGEPNYAWYNGASFGIYGDDGRASRPTFGSELLNVYMNHGDVEWAPWGCPALPAAYELYLSDMQQAWSVPLDRFEWIEPFLSDSSLRWIPENLYGYWFKVMCHVVRDLDNWSNGRVEWYVAFPTDNYVLHSLYKPLSGADDLGWNPATPIRTIGITPSEMLEQETQHWGYAPFCTGISNYQGIPDVPNDIYFDDVLLIGSHGDVTDDPGGGTATGGVGGFVAGYPGALGLYGARPPK